MVHSVGANIMTNAGKFSHNSIGGHYHSALGVAYHSDKARLRWHLATGSLLDPNSPAARYGAGNILKRPLLGTGLLLGSEGNTLIISDMHLPYHHCDAFDFLWYLHDKLECTEVLCVGDIYDHHKGSYHESEPDAYGSEEEYRLTKKYAQELQEMFPWMVITHGNHDEIPKRKLKSAGLPSSMLSDYNKLYETADTWVWTDSYWFDSKGAIPIAVPMTLNSKGRWNKKLPL